jgi:hypothetical protein
MVKLLDEPEKDLKCLAAETIGKKNYFLQIRK